MDSTEKTSTEVPSAAACAEAAAWIARLHGEDPTANVEKGFKRWLAASPEHRAAFEMANDIWLGVEQLPKPVTPMPVRWPRVAFVVTVPRALTVALVLGLIAVGVVLHNRDPDLATRVGEQRNLTLEDGTRISLNTASRVHVHYDRGVRRVELDHGEAFFEVAKRPQWPFIVMANGKQVIARGTAFLVRRDDQRLAVTLVEGKVTVAPEGEEVSSELRSAIASSNSPPSGPSADFTLSPGERITFVEHQTPELDRPSIERITAWRRGQVILDHTRLEDAVAEMNRYSNVQLKIQNPESARAEVTGVFRVGDSENFAHAVAETYKLEIVDSGGRILISGVPGG